MAQSEDTELRDLVIEALEKNGSLAKIRALLRANVFLAFEEDYDNIRQNVNLDNVLEVPEGVLALSVVYEFLEYCNLKNTLFVYMSESREGKQYRYEGRNILAEKCNVNLQNGSKQPLLLSLLKKTYKPTQRNVTGSSTEHIKRDKLNSEDQNCTYIVHEDSSSASSNSQSDQSSDEKNKLQQKLPLDNSDTDTSSDSMRGKTSAEYVANHHINLGNEQNYLLSSYQPFSKTSHPKSGKNESNLKGDNHASLYLQDLKLSNSSESTSYLDLKPYSAAEKRQMNTTGIPINESISDKSYYLPVSLKNNDKLSTQQEVASKEDLKSTETLSSVSSILNEEEKKKPEQQNVSKALEKVNIDNTEYSLDFTLSPVSKAKGNITEEQLNSSRSVQENLSARSEGKALENGSPQRHSSSQSSVSISDVADLIENSENNENFSKNDLKKDKQNLVKSTFDEDTSISESSVPSLSNLSFDIQSD